MSGYTKIFGSAVCAWLAFGCHKEPAISSLGYQAETLDVTATGGMPGDFETAMTGVSSMAPAEPRAPGLYREGDKMVFRTEDFTIPPLSERYLCWPATATETFKVSSFETLGQPVIHHFIFSRATGQEPEGISECDVPFKYGWRPLFASGAGRSVLSLPEGVAQSVDEGNQLVVQMHLLNATQLPVTDAAEIVMTITDEPETIPVRVALFGSARIMLPPAQPTQVVTECDIRSDMRVVGLFPHMHFLGTSLTFELGPTADSMELIYKRDPYSFHEQTIDSMDTVFKGGSHVRVTCSYNNNTSAIVRYGESSYDEMCFLAAFVAGRGMFPCIDGAENLLASFLN